MLWRHECIHLSFLNSHFLCRHRCLACVMGWEQRLIHLSWWLTYGETTCRITEVWMESGCWNVAKDKWRSRSNNRYDNKWSKTNYVTFYRNTSAEIIWGYKFNSSFFGHWRQSAISVCRDAYLISSYLNTIHNTIQFHKPRTWAVLHRWLRR